MSLLRDHVWHMSTIAYIQAAYFVLTGAWPLVHMPSFVRVTGPKVDLWLVRTVGALILVIGLAIGISAWQDHVPLSVLALAIGSALSLMLVDIVYVSQGIISRIYLGDAVLEALLVLGWVGLLITSGG